MLHHFKIVNMPSFKRKFMLFFKRNLYIIFCAGLLLMQGCANVGALNGGAKDTTAPKVVLGKSTPNKPVNFKKQRIILTFDEWVKLDDVFAQVVVSPPLNETPEVTLHGKSVWFDFAETEVLRENATYTINFGVAVKDLHESNPAKDLRFVFSTGATIDSLSVTGKVVDAVTSEPLDNILLMLYDNLADSAVKKVKPFYFSRTDKNGFARIENVRAGTFKVFALKDNDVNYLFNQETERIGFPLENLTLTSKNISTAPLDSATLTNDTLRRKADSLAAANSDLKIRLFDPIKPLKLTGREIDKYGVAKLTFNQEAKNAKITFDDIGQNAFTEASNDTLLVWNTAKDETPWSLYVPNNERIDTVRVRPRGQVDFMKKGKLSPLNEVSNISKHPTKPIIFSFNYPIQNIDNQLITLIDSAKKNRPLSILRDSLSKRKLIFNAAWEEGQSYQLTILPKALTDIYGFKNDTIATQINVQKKTDFSDIILTLSGLDSSKNYICQLVGGANNIEASYIVKNKKVFEQKMETIQIEKYVLKVIEDTNKNGKWDTGDYDTKLQPERIFLKEVESLRPNFEIELAFDISDL
jgi:uncharacterized protein (DUF2141 family)